MIASNSGASNARKCVFTQRKLKGQNPTTQKVLNESPASAYSFSPFQILGASGLIQNCPLLTQRPEFRIQSLMWFMESFQDSYKSHYCFETVLVTRTDLDDICAIFPSIQLLEKAFKANCNAVYTMCPLLFILFQLLIDLTDTVFLRKYKAKLKSYRSSSISKQK